MVRLFAAEDLGLHVDIEGGGRFMLEADEAGGKPTGKTTMASRLYHAALRWTVCDTVVSVDPSWLKLHAGLEHADDAGATQPVDQPRLDGVRGDAGRCGGSHEDVVGGFARPDCLFYGAGWRATLEGEPGHDHRALGADGALPERLGGNLAGRVGSVFGPELELDLDPLQRTKPPVGRGEPETLRFLVGGTTAI